MKFLSLLITSCALSSLTFANQPIPSIFNIDNGKIVQTTPKIQIDPNTIYTHLNTYLSLPNSYSFRVIKDETDHLGMRHIAAEQYFQGIKIDGGIILTHFKGNELRSVQGMIANFESFNIKAAFPSEKASKEVASFLALKKITHTEPTELIIYMDMEHESNPYQLMYQVRMDGINQEGIFTAQTILVNAQDGSIYTTFPHVYHGDVTHTANTYLYGTRNITVDSLSPNSFELRDNGRKIETYHAAGAASGGWNDLFATARIFNNNNQVWNTQLAINSVKITAIDSAMTANRNDSNKLFFEIRDFNNTPISWITSTNGPNYSIRNLFSFFQPNTTNSIVVGLEHTRTGDTTFTQVIPLLNNTVGTHTFSYANDSIRGEYTIQDVKNPGLDIHWGMGKTHDFYLDKFNRNSFNNRGGLVRNYFDGVYPLYASQSNAAALGSPYNIMVYGNGTTIPYVALDVCGHEFTHLVVNENGTGGLRYQGESGALNESFADIMGTAIEFYSLGDSVANYLIGEDVMGGNGFMRSMENPNSKNYPDTYQGRYWVSTTNTYDNGGVHFNSSVQNYWYYLLCEGGEGTNDNDYNYKVTKIGREKATQIAYRNLTTYLTNRAKFQDAYEGSLKAALDLYGNGSDTTVAEYIAVKAAWCAVGLGTCINEVAPPAPEPPVVPVIPSLSVYPNPTTEYIKATSTWEENIAVKLYDISGKLIHSFTFQKGENQISVLHLAKGTYLIKAQLPNGKMYIEKISIL